MDKARVWTDKHLAHMEGHIRWVYRMARKDLIEKWNAYMLRGQDRLQTLYAAYLDAPDKQKADALKRYQDALRNYTLRNKWYRDMVNDTTYRLAQVNDLAVSYVNGEIPAIYVQNYNPVDPDALLVRQTWTIRSEHTLSNLIRESLPDRELDYAKDMAWNQRQLNNAVLQGIIQGEGIPKIAKRILPIVKNNEVASIRTARTMVTEAENRGRLDRYAEYEDEGIITHKVWIATPDGRTRAWHLSMDGQEVPVDEPFIDGHGEELDYPGDPSGSPKTIYNCRCSMRSQIIGVRGRNGAMIPISRYRDGSELHARQIASEREKRG